MVYCMCVILIVFNCFRELFFVPLQITFNLWCSLRKHFCTEYIIGSHTRLCQSPDKSLHAKTTVTHFRFLYVKDLTGQENGGGNHVTLFALYLYHTHNSKKKKKNTLIRVRTLSNDCSRTIGCHSALKSSSWT